MDVVDYETIEDVQLNIASQNSSGVNNSTVPGVNAPMLDANTSVNNIPEGGGGSTDTVGRSTSIVWSATDSDTVAWSSGTITLGDATSYSIDAGNTGNMSAVTYIYIDTATSETTLQTTTTSSTAVGTGKILVCVAKNSASPTLAQFQAFGTLGNGVFITADNIAANTITANEIATNYVYAGTINADNITSGTLTGRTIQTSTSGQRVVIDSNNVITFYDSSGNPATLYGNAGALYTNGLVVFGSSSAVGFSGKMKIPVGTNLY